MQPKPPNVPAIPTAFRIKEHVSDRMSTLVQKTATPNEV